MKVTEHKMTNMSENYRNNGEYYWKCTKIKKKIYRTNVTHISNSTAENRLHR